MRANRKKNNRGKRTQLEYVAKVPHGISLMPDKMIVDLRWRQDFTLSGSASVAKRFHTNCLWDVDPALGGFAVNGFNTWSVFYSYNRVTKYWVDLNLATLELVPLTLDFVHLNVDPGTSPVSYPQYALQAYGHTDQLTSLTGVGKLKYTAEHTIREIVGDRLPATSERYVGSSTANPTDATYFGICATDNIRAMPDGVQCVLIMTFRCEFFDRKNVDDV
jgi:hypothetical protein